MKRPKDIVREGYDKVSFAYRGDEPERKVGAGTHDLDEYKAWVGELTTRLPPRSAILDLGCGCGLPATKLLAEEYVVTGCDISQVQIERARGASSQCHLPVQ